MLLQLLVVAAQYALLQAITPALAEGLARLLPVILGALAATALGACCAVWVVTAFVVAIFRYASRADSAPLVDSGAPA